MKKDTTLKIIVFSLLGLLILWLASSLLFSTGNGISINFRGNYGGEHMYMGSSYGIGFGGTISVLLMFLIKLLFFVFVAALIIGLIIVVKNSIFTPEDIATIKGAFNSKDKTPEKICDACGKALDKEWKACPYCGKESDNTNEVEN
ncbi:zinc ribbon domain-containing protein [Clostridium chromiireducens]|uniref:Zinc ribbon domain-containing protein n=1 Tax=Clostridium chromiireducens TaxID=225345 RepID=A0A399IGI3_9CLOT|nr:zinc ribbon domain-containing protein [Clostridium chromiireducens]RII31811.1 zinc ribbon domain-containing protein [Clostridium chromiireducens]